MSIDTLEEIFHPKSVAVVGASNNPAASGYNFTRHLVDYGYRGKIYPVNPNYQDIFGIKAYPSLGDVPGSIDYVISCIPSSGVLDMLEDCSRKRVKVVHLFTARFSETGHREAAELEREVLKRARERGIRLIGPNCMGIYYPREGLSFGYDFPKESGSVGFISQTGGGATALIYLSSLRGIRFSKVISYGNALDYSESDFLDYFAQDPETKIILMYVEGVRDGRRFFDALRCAASTKPVIIIKGGREESGARAAASHTASLAGSMQVWETLVTQAGAISAQSFEEMVDVAVSFYFLPAIRGFRVGVVGEGGGSSVLSADECEEAGLNVITLPMEIREQLKRKVPLLWDWLGNPTDVSILGGIEFTGSDMLQMMAENPNFDLLITVINESAPQRKEEVMLRLKQELQGCARVKKESSKPLLAVVGEKSLSLENHNNWRWKKLSKARTKLIGMGIPVYPTTGRAAGAARKMIEYYLRRE